MLDKDIVEVYTSPNGAHYALFKDGSIKISTAQCKPEKVCVWFPLGKRSTRLLKELHFNK